MSWLSDIFSSKQTAPVAPSAAPQMAISNEVAQQAVQLSQQQFGWAQGVYNNLAANAASTASDVKATADTVNSLMDTAKQYVSANQTQANAFVNTQARNNNFADTAQVVYENTALPNLMALSHEADTYDTKEREAYEVNRAQAGVAQQFEGQRQAALQNLESYGINPSSTRYAALDANARTAQAAAAAGAGNQAALQHEQTAHNLRSNVVQLGAALPGMAAQAESNANAAGTGVINANTAGNQAVLGAGQLALGAGNLELGAGNLQNNVGAIGGQLMGTPTQYSTIANTAAGTSGALQNNAYDNSLNQYKADQTSSSGVGAALGTAVGAATKIAPMLLAEGGAVPVEAQPRGAPPVDGVPANLTVGEFVIPHDVAKWKGEEFFQGLIKKSREAKAGAQAKPTVGPSPTGNQRPTFQSRPAGGGALPLARAA